MAIVSDQSKLVLNAFAATFQNQLACADLVTWKQYDGEFEDRNRLQFSEQVGPRYDVTETVNGVADLSSGVQDTVFGSEQFTVDRTFGSSMGWGDFEKIRDIGAARESMALKAAATQLAEKIDAHIVRAAVLASNNWLGTPGTNVSTYDHIASAYTRLKEEGVDDSDLRAILSYHDKQALGSTVISSTTNLEGMAGGVYKSGFESQVAGIPTMFTQQLPTFTAGTRTNGAVNGANQNVNYSAVSVSAAPGQYLTQTINVDGLGANATVVDGDVFTVANVNAYDNRLGASLARPQQFRVVGNYTATVGGVLNNMRIFPAIIVPGSGSGGDVAVNRANATVTAAPADDAVVTWAVAAGTSVRPRAIIQKQAIVVNTVDLITPASGQSMRKSLTKVPLSVRMWRDSTFNTGEHKVRFDVMLRANVRERRRITRLNG